MKVQIKEVRLAAIKGIATLGRTNNHRDFLTRLARQSGDIEVRAEALKALRFQLTEQDIRWWRLARDMRGNSRDPTGQVKDRPLHLGGEVFF